MTTYQQLYVHAVWSTWDRLALITPTLESEIYAALAAKCTEHTCVALAIGGIEDHVHVLVQLAPTITIARLVGEMKGASAHLVTHQLQPGCFFKWQRSYGAFTVSKSILPRAHNYITHQKHHHATGTIYRDIEPFDNADSV